LNWIRGCQSCYCVECHAVRQKHAANRDIACRLLIVGFLLGLIFYSMVGQPNTSQGPNLTYRTPSGARYSVSFRRVVNFQDMNTAVRKELEVSNTARTHTPSYHLTSLFKSYIESTN
jgi:hypothetical protein